MENTFQPNDEYISCLIKHSILTKERGGNSREVLESKKKLTKMELRLSCEEIIKNTKIAFKD